MKKSLSLKILLFGTSFFATAMAYSSPGILKTSQSYNSTENSKIAGKVVIDLSKRGQTITSSFYGSHLDSFSQAPSPALVSELGIGQIRIGGNEYDVFNWKNNLSYTKTGLYNILGFVGTDALLRNYKVTGIYQINLLGYQPDIIGNNVVLENTFTDHSAYELIKTLNGELNLGIVNFSLGNEPEQWHETHSHTKAFSPDSGISADEYITKYIKFAIAIRAAQEEINGNPNSIKIWGPEISSSWLDWNTGNFTKDCQWSDTVRGQVVCSYGGGSFHQFIPYFLYRLSKAEKDPAVNPKGYKLLDYFAFHYYPNFRTKIADTNSMITAPDGRQWVSKMLEATRALNDPTYINTVDLSTYKNTSPNIINRMKSWLASYYPNAKLALNEFAVDSDYRTTNYHPIVRPLYTADAVGIAATEGVSFFNNFVLNSAPGSMIPWTMLDGGTQKTNMFYMYALLSNNFKGTIVASDDNMGDLVNSYAADDGKAVNLVLINKSPTDRTVQIYLKSSSLKKMATYVVPGWSTSVLKIEKNPTSGKGFEVNQFGAKEMGIQLDVNYSKF
ncbi:MAG TPA: glycoside hydrolase family 44 protein [Bdellovibrio sp.]|uniref:glycoside hydrolase family 44 protein n=1 Tax=Bdellovibrio sp. TaxID=28201 RepID=UPI002F097D48